MVVAWVVNIYSSSELAHGGDSGHTTEDAYCFLLILQSTYEINGVSYNLSICLHRYARKPGLPWDWDIHLHNPGKLKATT